VRLLLETRLHFIYRLLAPRASADVGSTVATYEVSREGRRINYSRSVDQTFSPTNRINSRVESIILAAVVDVFAAVVVAIVIESIGRPPKICPERPALAQASTDVCSGNTSLSLSFTLRRKRSDD
jgi:hypothetical protein